MATRFGIMLAALIFALGCSSRSETDRQTAETSTPRTEAGRMSEMAGPPPVSGDTITTASGLKYILTQSGSGPTPERGRQVQVHYTGWLTDGRKFDSSVDRGQPFSFPLGQGQVIRGWDEGVAGMQVGEKRRLIIPPELGYGPGGFPGAVPPNATLIFDVELLDVDG
jgi:FKBP-type peptidyl-prolyl cis-trans isomerase